MLDYLNILVRPNGTIGVVKTICSWHEYTYMTTCVPEAGIKNMDK